MSFSKETEKKHEMMLNLVGQKSDNFFEADQTPTPTRFIKNCEEVGLFDDLQHVNPFEETFRRAVEQKVCHTPNTHPDDEDSLHTPQVFPQLDSNDDGEYGLCKTLQKPAEKRHSDEVTLDVPAVEDILSTVNSYARNPATRQNSAGSTITSLEYVKMNKYRNIAEKPTIAQQSIEGSGTTSFVQLPAAASIQLIQPQVITLSFPSSNEVASMKQAAAIPVQTVKPFILPKLTTTLKQSGQLIPNGATSTATEATTTQPPNEPSSASLTPTSQLPIKERLKAILSHSSKSRIIEIPQYHTNSRRSRGPHEKNHVKYDEDCIERRRAAATRYRNKMRNEHKELRQRNSELQADNEKLRERIKHLEQELANQPYLGNGLQPAHIQIPSSTVHVVMNIPKMLVTPNGRPIMQNPITYRVEKK